MFLLFELSHRKQTPHIIYEAVIALRQLLLFLFICMNELLKTDIDPKILEKLTLGTYRRRHPKLVGDGAKRAKIYMA